jgi:predicted nucleic acid-binding protein
VDGASNGSVRLFACSEVYDDVVAALRSQNISLQKVSGFLDDMKAIPHRTVTVNLDVAVRAIELYRKHGGSRKLHYFDSYHVATSQIEKLPLLTSDKFIIDHANPFEIDVIDARTIRP